MTDTAPAGAPAMAVASAHTFVPYVLGTDRKFEACLPDTLIEEGGYSNDAHDPGGMTMFGIIQREYDAARRSWGLSTQWVKKISPDEYRTIYYQNYWLPDCPEIWFGMDLQVFDLNVNAGPHRSMVTLQRALKIPDDGVFGPQTKAALSLYSTPDSQVRACRAFKTQREAFYRSLGTFRYFGKDWIGRSERIDAKAEKMVTAPVISGSNAMENALDQFVADKQ